MYSLMDSIGRIRSIASSACSMALNQTPLLLGWIPKIHRPPTPTNHFEILHQHVEQVFQQIQALVSVFEQARGSKYSLNRDEFKRVFKLQVDISCEGRHCE